MNRCHRMFWTCLLAFSPSTMVLGDDDVRTTPTWHSGIQTLVASHCTECHNPRGAAPFVLETPQDFRARRTFVSHVVQAGLMPPWLPDKGVSLHGARVLSKEDQVRLLSWLAAGCPIGEPPPKPDPVSVDPATPAPAPAPEKTSPPPAYVPMSVAMRAPWMVPAEGGLRWFKAERDKRTFVLPLENTFPLRVQALEYLSTAPQTLGAVALSADPTGDGRTMVDWDEEPGSYMMADIRAVPAGALGIIGPGGGRLEYPSGFYVPVPAGSDIMSEVHYRPQGRERVLNDQLTLETLQAEAKARPLMPLNLMVPRVQLEPGERKSYRNEFTLPVAVDLVALTPRASRRCTSLKLTARLPESESPLLLLEVADWNPHYRSTLVLEKPLRLPAGTVVQGVWRYDNSEANPRNPVIPPEKVNLGARSGAMNVLLMSAPVNRIDIRALIDFMASESVRNRG